MKFPQHLLNIRDKFKLKSYTNIDFQFLSNKQPFYHLKFLIKLFYYL